MNHEGIDTADDSGEEIDYNEFQDDGSYDFVQEDDDGLGGGDAAATSWSPLTFKCIPSNLLASAMTSTIKEASNLLQIPETTVRLLLAHFKWDTDRLLERYFEDSSVTLADAHVSDPRNSSSPNSQKFSGNSSQASESSKKSKMSAKVRCNICLDDVDEQSASELACGHRFCMDCWTSYIKNRVAQSNEIIECPEPKCSMLADDAFVREHLRDCNPAITERFESLILQSFVTNNHLMKWCGSANCDQAFQLSSKGWVPLLCDNCHVEWCSLCSYNWHYPVTCQYFKKWLKKNADDSETAHWINANTKDCPKCHAPIEKNGGCNHISCRSKSCNHEFCWVCMNDWSKHGNGAYNCNRYEEAPPSGSKEHARVSLERYLFFYTRYANHEKSCELEKKLQITVKAKIEELQFIYEMARPEALFLQQALDALGRCRRTLMYTYAFAYFLRKTGQCEIFLENQADLEQKTESLSEYLETKFDEVDDIKKMKQDVQDKTRYCEQRRQRLIEYVQEGYNNRSWDMID